MKPYRQRVDLTGLAQQPDGSWRAWVWVPDPRRPKRGRNRSHRFPADTDLAEMQAWRAKQKAKPEKDKQPDDAKTDLAADAVTYLELVHAMPTYATRKQHIEEWVRELGPGRDRADVTTLEVARVLARWQRDRHYGPVTLNHRRGALSHLYTRLDPAGPNPVRAAPKFRPPEPEPRGLPLEVVTAILDALPPKDVKGRGSAPSRTAAHLRVLATTGMPPAVIAQLQPEHLAQLDQGIILRPGRRKGKGTPASRHPVTPYGAAALRAFAALAAWGAVPSSTRLIVWRRAVARVRAHHPEWSIPVGVRPYDLRHSLGDAVFEAGGLVMVQEVLGHADIRTSRRYAAGAISRGEAEAVAKVAKAWKAAAKRGGPGAPRVE